MGFLKRISNASAAGLAERGAYELVDNVNAEREAFLSETEPPHRPSIIGQQPTEVELKTLRHVSDDLPWSAFLVAIVELCERFTYYGLSGPFQNYIANSYHDANGLPGAIGLGQHGATALTNFFQFWCYVTPVLGAVVADQYLGKYWTIYWSAVVYVVGIVILFLTSLPSAINDGFALFGLVSAMLVIGLGTGGIKSNVSPLIAEQYRGTEAFVKKLKGGEKIIVSPEVTIQRIYMIFYMCINVGSLSSLITTTMEMKVGFWSAYLLCLCMFIVGYVTLIAGKKRYVLHPPRGSVIPHALKICWTGLSKGCLNAADPDRLDPSGRRITVPWDSTLVHDVRQALSACKVFAFYPIYWCVYSQTMNNFISQAGQMQLHGIPNDIMQNVDPITILMFIPLCDALLYPTLRSAGIPFGPMSRITTGFFLAACAMFYAAWVQHLIYTSPPCYDAPRACDAALRLDGTYAPNDVHVAIQTPAYLFIGLSEIFASVTGLELAFTRAPPSMKSFVMSLFLLTNAFGSVLGAGVSPFAVDPQLSWMYLGLATVCLTTGCIFWIVSWKLGNGRDA